MNKLLTSTFAALLVFQLGNVQAQAAGTGTETATKAADESATAPAAAPVAKAADAGKTHEAITGAFGITLSQPFDAASVARVIAQQPASYRGHDGLEHTGTQYQVEPAQPDGRFQRYTVKTTDKGIVYAIMAEYQLEADADLLKTDKAKASKALRSACKAEVRALAKELEDRYGEPRGKGWDAEWFSFRQSSETTKKRIRVLGNRCRTGIYSVVYSDEYLTGQSGKAKQQQSSQAAPES